MLLETQWERSVATKPTPPREPVSQEPETAKLKAWKHVREVWKASGKIPHVTDALLEAEYEAANTD